MGNNMIKRHAHLWLPPFVYFIDTLLCTSLYELQNAMHYYFKKSNSGVAQVQQVDRCLPEELCLLLPVFPIASALEAEYYWAAEWIWLEVIDRPILSSPVPRGATAPKWLPLHLVSFRQPLASPQVKDIFIIFPSGKAQAPQWGYIKVGYFAARRYEARRIR